MDRLRQVVRGVNGKPAANVHREVRAVLIDQVDHRRRRLHRSIIATQEFIHPMYSAVLYRMFESSVPYPNRSALIRMDSTTSPSACRSDAAFQSTIISIRSIRFMFR